MAVKCLDVSLKMFKLHLNVISTCGQMLKHYLSDPLLSHNHLPPGMKVSTYLSEHFETHCRNVDAISMKHTKLTYSCFAETYNANILFWAVYIKERQNGNFTYEYQCRPVSNSKRYCCFEPLNPL